MYFDNTALNRTMFLNVVTSRGDGFYSKAEARVECAELLLMVRAKDNVA
jgi:hypothetical protein